MSRRFETRSKEAPMDFEYTSRTRTIPVWSQHATQKRDRDSDAPSPPSFSSNSNTPFLFHSPPPKTTPFQPWTPAAGGTSSGPTSDVPDITMEEVNPPRAEETNVSLESPNDTTMNDSSMYEREKSDRPIAQGALRRVFRSRNRRRERHRSSRDSARASDEDSTSEGEEPDYRRISRKTSNHYTLNMAPAPLLSHSDKSQSILDYVPKFFNASLVFIFFYVVYAVFTMVQRDVQHKASEYSLEILQEISTCTSLFKANRCSEPLPAMVRQCAEWEACMNRDPTVVGRTRVGAETIGEAINSLVEPISYKTWIFLLIFLAFSIVFVNFYLPMLSSRHPAATHPYSNNPHFNHFPPSHVMDPRMSNHSWSSMQGEDPSTQRNQRRRLE